MIFYTTINLIINLFIMLFAKSSKANTLSLLRKSNVHSEMYDVLSREKHWDKLNEQGEH